MTNNYLSNKNMIYKNWIDYKYLLFDLKYVV